MQSNEKRLERVETPENLGISSAAFIKAVHMLEDTMLFHSLMVVRHGKVAAECYRYPFNRDTAHTMYSVSKTITATAVGFAVSEGFLSMETRFLDIFPEYAPKKRDEKLEKLCVKHLVTLSGGLITSPLLTKTSEDWLRQLTGGKWVAFPGERFDYVNEDMYALCAIVQRATGQTVVDFLNSRLFAPLGIEKPFWETDHHGVEAGGWGIYLKTEDLSKIMYCYLNGGKWGEKQVLPAEWAAEAIKPQGFFKGKPIDGDCYGYGIWVVSDSEFRARGMFDQLSAALIAEDTVITVTSCNNDETPFWNMIAELKGELFVEENPAAKAEDSFIEFVNSQCLDNIPVTEIRSPMEKSISGRAVHFRRNYLANIVGFPTSVLNTADVFMSRCHGGNIDHVVFTFSGDEGTFAWSENGEKNNVDFGLDGRYRFSPMKLCGTPYTAACTAFWIDESTLEIWLRPVESLARRMMKFSFCGNRVTMLPSSDPPMEKFVEAIAGTVEDMVKPKLMKKAARFGLRKFRELLEHKHYGKIM